MSLLSTSVNPRYLEAIQQFRLIDDTFFNICFDGDISCMQLILRIFLKRDDLNVREVVTQNSAHNLYGRSVRFDIIAIDKDGKLYNVEIQRSNEGANPRRARFNHAILDSREINKNTQYQDFPETWVIFITENDIFNASLSMYHIERMITELQRPFGDAAHIIYVNGEYKGTDALGLLMHDFFCPDPDKMHYPELANRVDFFKHETKGVNAMCEIMQRLQDEGRAEGREEGAKLADSRTAKRMLAKNKSIEEILELVELSRTEIEELAKQLK